MTLTKNSPDPQSQIPLIIIEPKTGWRSLGLVEVWQYRELLFYLTWRSLRIRYKQTILGISWAIIQPLMTMVVFSIFFGNLAKIPSDGIPYPIFSFAALVPWTFFSTSLTNVSNSIVSNSNMLKKIYFPRFIMPFSAVLSGLVDFALAFVVLLGMILYYMATTPTPLIYALGWLGLAPDFGQSYGLAITANIVWLPFLILLATLAALGVGLWLAALNVQFRDIRFAIGFIVRIWMFITPVVYPSSMLGEEWQLIYSLNPMTGVIEGFRWALLGTNTAPGSMIIISTIVSLIALFSGMIFFRRMERTFADVV